MLCHRRGDLWCRCTCLHVCPEYLASRVCSGSSVRAAAGIHRSLSRYSLDVHGDLGLWRSGNNASLGYNLSAFVDHHALAGGRAEHSTQSVFFGDSAIIWRAFGGMWFASVLLNRRTLWRGSDTFLGGDGHSSRGVGRAVFHCFYQSENTANLCLGLMS